MKKEAVVITGGAGYIGSHIVHSFTQREVTVIVVDHQANYAHIETFIKQFGGVYICADFACPDAWHTIVASYDITTVIHCAAFIDVGQSVSDPALYYDNNVLKTIKLLSILKNYSINNIIFSSSCSVYGKPNYIPLDEQHSLVPLSPYANSKYIIETLLRDYERAYGLKFVSLRYFNAAGSLHEYNLGERHDPETHIIPLAIKAAQQKKEFVIFGTDYDTPDGTCIRDYVHIVDLADAHLFAYDHLMRNGYSLIANVGTGTGNSVRQIIASIENITGLRIKIRETDRRIGDSPVLCADPLYIGNTLGWKAQFQLADMIESSYRFLTKSCIQF